MHIHFKFEFVRVSGFQAGPQKKNTFTLFLSETDKITLWADLCAWLLLGAVEEEGRKARKDHDAHRRGSG